MSEMLVAMRRSFDANGYIQLPEMFDEKLARVILANAQFERDEEPLSHKYAIAALPRSVVEQLVTLAAQIAGKDLRVTAVDLVELGWRDFSMILDNKQAKTTEFDILVDIAKSFPANAGGAIVFGDGKDTWSVEPQFCTFTLVKRTTAMQSFYQYVNNKAGKNKRTFIHIVGV